MLNSIASGNPQLQNVMQLIQQSGGDPKKAFYDVARQRGVDPEQIISIINNFK